ncbi:MAG: hypothetical protein LH472_04020 [Pyrinomonadaceae bacterium]|nr:hypothetical protein [Pyrinomonadaceae bacterium]
MKNFLISVSIFVFLLGNTSYAQTANATLTGVVTDQIGAVIPNATVTTINFLLFVTVFSAVSAIGITSRRFLPSQAIFSARWRAASSARFSRLPVSGKLRGFRAKSKIRRKICRRRWQSA